MFIVVVNCWFASASDDRICVFLEQAQSLDQAKMQAIKRLSIDENQIFSIEVKAVEKENAGLIFMQD